jgi:nucleotide-binding universal stress UspA family protein
VLAEGVELARKAGFAVEGRLERTAGAPWRAILDAADELDATLIVVGARGLTAVESLVLGAVSNAVVHHTKRPVLVVRKLS